MLFGINVKLKTSYNSLMGDDVKARLKRFHNLELNIENSIKRSN